MDRSEEDVFQLVGQATERTPKLHAFNRLRDDANAGDPFAKQRIDELLDQLPNLVGGMFDGVAIMRQTIIEQLAGDDYLLSQAVEKRLDNEIEAIGPASGISAIDRLKAELQAMAWLDAFRCTVNAARDYDRRGDADHFAKLAAAAVKRFTKLTSK